MDLGTVEELTVARSRAEIHSRTAGHAVLAGGTWLLSEPQNHITRLIDITALDWPPITRTDSGIDISATCTIETLSTAFDASYPATVLFQQCAGALLASYKIWKTATVGGNICMALPAGAMISLTVALDGIGLIWAADGSEYRIPIVDLVLGPVDTALAPGDVLRTIELPSHALRSRTAFRKVALSPLGRSASVVIGRLDEDGKFFVTVSAGTSRPCVLEFPMIPTPDELEASIESGISAELWYDDAHGSPDWRRHLAHVSAREILEELR